MIERKWLTPNGVVVYLVDDILYFYTADNNPHLEVGSKAPINTMLIFKPYKTLEQYNRYLIQQLDEAESKVFV
ncbi:hypothetical protein IGB11_06730 [Ligilactobacillus salivarius]|uniref:hypothetical protein n=1 Tax=Ligilactobacillus salivarius TaxID=1624 RepID=UPI0017874F86|nr:hypothetical protein [Ligilactobacillus salivarius]QXL48877.1 hypothetical protein IGB11_06730 [Ligilactobacillus salivarius]